MTVVMGKGRQSTSIAREPEGADVFLRALRDGTVIESDWRQAAIMGGFGYMVSDGSFTTGQTGGGQGTVPVVRQPEVMSSVPNGYCILPMRVDVVIQPGSFATVAEETHILIAVDELTAFDAVGTFDTLSVYNLNTVCGKTSVCTAAGGFSADGTATTQDFEVAHWVSNVDASGTEASFMWSQFNVVYEPKRLMVINGPAMVTVHFGGSIVANGFTTVQWLEFPETAFAI